MSNPIRVRAAGINNPYAKLWKDDEHLSEVYRRDPVRIAGHLISDGRDPKEILDGVNKAQKALTLEELYDFVVASDCFLPRPAVRMESARAAGRVFARGTENRLLAITNDFPTTLQRRSALGVFVRDTCLMWIRERTRERMRKEAAYREMADSAEGALGETFEHLRAYADSVMRGYAVTPYSYNLRNAVRAQNSWCVFHSPQSVEDACEKKFYVNSCSPAGTLGRLKKATHRKQKRVWRITPPTDEELADSLLHCGFVLCSPALQAAYGELFLGCEVPWELVAGDADDGNRVTVVKQADLGFPYLTKGTNPEAMAQAVADAADLARAWSGDVQRRYNMAMTTHPSAILCTFKAKQDMYSSEKILGNQLRVYNVIPAPLKFNIAQVCQPFATARVTYQMIHSIQHAGRHTELPHPECRRLGFHRSAQKMGLTGGNPSLVVQSLDEQLVADGFGIVHAGDDTVIVFLRDEGGLPWVTSASIDCSNFDLTQEIEVIGGIHRSFHRALERIDKDRADMWLCVATKRLVNFVGSTVVEATGLGTSGLNLVSEVNDILADVLAKRVRKHVLSRSTLKTYVSEEGENCVLRVVEGMDEAELENITINAARTLALEARIDNFSSVPIEPCGRDEGWGAGWNPVNAGLLQGMKIQFLGATLASIDVLSPCFLDLESSLPGTSWHREVRGGPDDPHFPGWRVPGDEVLKGEAVVAVPDLTRLVPSLAYPKGGYEPDDRVHKAKEVRRIHSMLVGSGFFFRCMPAPYRRAIGRAMLQALEEAGQVRFDCATEDVYFGDALGSLRDTEALRESVISFCLSETTFQPDSVRSALVEGGPTFQVPLGDPMYPFIVPRWVPPLQEAAPPEPLMELDPLGMSWADAVEQDAEDREALALFALGAGEGEVNLTDLAEGVPPRIGAPNLAALAYRAVSRANFGRPPPNVAVRNNPLPRAQQERATPAGGMTKSQRKNAKRKARKSKGNRGGDQYDEFAQVRDLLPDF